jgi:integrase
MIYVRFFVEQPSKRMIQMASVSKDPSGKYRIQFEAPDGRRRTLRLPVTEKKTALGIAVHVERLLAQKIAGQPIPKETAMWLATIGTELRNRLVKVGLAEAANILTLEEFLANWLETKREMGHKVASLVAWGQTVNCLLDSLGSNKVLVEVTHTNGEVFRGYLQDRGLRPSTISKRLGHARAMLEDAVRLGHINANPWKYVRQRGGDPSERRAYVPLADIERVIDHCPNIHWKLLVALARFVGVRVPSEALSLTWADVDWERGRLNIPSPKTEHLGKTHRVVPMFPMIRPYLELAFEQAPEGTVYVFPEDWRRRTQGPRGWANANLRTTLGKIIRRAHIEPWPRLFHNLRASCESDLAQSFPLAIVTKWLGNTPSVALRHYVDPTEAAFEQAKEWTPKRGAKSDVMEGQNPTLQASAENCTIVNPIPQVVTIEELEQSPSSSYNQTILQKLEAAGNRVHFSCHSQVL